MHNTLARVVWIGLEYGCYYSYYSRSLVTSEQYNLSINIIIILSYSI